MIKFVSIVISVMSLNYTASLTPIGTQLEDVEVEFSEKAIGIESGQPIFPKNTKIWVSNPKKEKIKLFINDEEKEVKDEKVEITGLKEGTYTLMIVASEETSDEKKTVGFTIQ